MPNPKVSEPSETPSGTVRETPNHQDQETRNLKLCVRSTLAAQWPPPLAGLEPSDPREYSENENRQQRVIGGITRRTVEHTLALGRKIRDHLRLGTWCSKNNIREAEDPPRPFFLICYRVSIACPEPQTEDVITV